MTLGRTSSGAIKIKTDTAGGGLRAVECACCVPQDFQPCRDCPPVLGNWIFSLSGDQINGYTSFEYPPDNQYAPLRTCFDFWDAFGPGTFGDRLYMITLSRAAGGWYGAPLGTPCCWVLNLFISGYFEYELDGGLDICGVNAGSNVVILSPNPVGTYPFTLSAQCVPPFMGGPTDFNFTVTVS